MVNWIAMLIGMFVPFFLSPFTVHHLGNVVYGIWILVVSSVSYFYLLDLGLRNAITSFVSRYHTLGDHEESKRVVSSAVWIRIAISFVIVVLAAIVALAFPHIFSVPTRLWYASRCAILLTALSLAITLCSGVPGAVLAALHRYDLLSFVNIFRAFFRAAGFVFLLQRGHGLAALAAWELVAAVVTGAALTSLCAKAFPELRHFMRRPERETIGKIWNYGAYAFLVTMAGAVVTYMDNGIVGLFLNPIAVTFYAIAGNLILYSREAIAAMSNTFVPIASGFEAEGRIAQLGRLLIRGTQASLLLSLPMVIVLFVRGRTFIGLWMGAEYAQVSGTVLQILLLNQLLTTANLTSCGIVYGIGKHKPLAMWALTEAGVNLVLSILLVRRVGLYGVAWGTCIAGVICNLLFWPRYMSKLLQISLPQYLWKAWGVTALAAVPFGIACWYQERLWAVSSLSGFFLQTAAILPLLLLTASLMFWRDVPPRLRAHLSRSWSRA